jgi:hypothetical protein
MKSIEIVISPKGETTVQTKGFIGGSCREASRALEEVLGVKAEERMTGEFYQTQDVQNNQRLSR